jgi:hypothetical protein
MWTAELKQNLKYLHLPTVRQCYEEVARQAERESLSYEWYLHELVQRECEERTDQDYAVSTREYQTDQSSLKTAPTCCSLCPRTATKTTTTTNPGIANVDTVTPYLAYKLISYAPPRHLFCHRPRHLPFATKQEAVMIISLSAALSSSRKLNKSSTVLFSSSFVHQEDVATGVSLNRAEIFHRRSFP